MLAVIKKELKNYFLSPIGYVVIGIFLLAFSSLFYITTINQSSINLTYLFYYTAFYVLMFIIPLITMWAFAGEKKNGTDQILLTAPVSMLGVVIAKFLAAFLLVVIPTICTLLYFGILSFFEVPNVPIYLTTILGFLLLSAVYISFGILASSLTETPIISGIITFAIIFIGNFAPDMIESLSKFSLMDHFVKFLYGQIDIASIVLFISLIILTVLITMIIMQRRKSLK